MGMLRTLALGWAGYSLYSAWRQRGRNIGDASVKPAPPLQRWEDEGGNVPDANPALQADGSAGDSAVPAGPPARSAG